MDDKVKLLKSYEKKIDEILLSKDRNAAEKLQKEFIGVFYSEIQDLTLNLDSYVHLNPDYLSDLKLIRAKLLNYKASLKNNLRGNFANILASHPKISVFSIAASCLTVYLGVTAFIMNISNTTIVGKDNYILKTELDKQYVSREQYNTDIQKLQSDNKKLLANEIDNNSLKSEYTKGWFTRYDQLKKERDCFEKELKILINLSSGIAGYDEAKNIEQKQELQRKIDSRKEEINILLTQLQLVNYEK